MAYPTEGAPLGPEHRECQRYQAADAHRIANGESLLQEAMKMLLPTSRLRARIEYFLEHHKPMRSKAAAYKQLGRRMAHGGADMQPGDESTPQLHEGDK